MALRDRLFDAYFSMERRIVPDLRYSQSHFESLLGEYVTADTRWLDIGCGRHLLPPWRAQQERSLLARCKQVVGIDLDHASLRDNRSIPLLSLSSVRELPFRDGAFSLVTANMVVEHLASPEAELREMRRVLVPGGLAMIHTPNAGAYPTAIARLLPDAAKRSLARVLEGRESKDVFPTYYRANSPAALRDLAASAGFEVAALHLVSTNGSLALIPPLAFIELLWIRYVSAESRAQMRSNMIAVLRRV